MRGVAAAGAVARRVFAARRVLALAGVVASPLLQAQTSVPAPPPPPPPAAAASAPSAGAAPASNSASTPTSTPTPTPAAAAAPAAPQRIVVEGRNVDPRRMSTAAMTVVGRDELDQHGDISLLDVLQRLPGITVDGDTPRMRGLGEGYTLILINGEPAPPGFSLDTLAPADIERIEVIKGPSAEFGGVAGTINVILRTPPRVRQREARVSLGYRKLAPQGSASLAWGDRVGEGASALAFHLPLTVYTWANGADTRTERSNRTATGEAREQLQRGADRWRGRGLNFSPRLEWRPADGHTLQWQAFVQGNASDNRSTRDTLLLSGPPLDSVRDDSASEGDWRLARTQLQWVRRQQDGTRFELKAGAQTSLSQSTGRGDARRADGSLFRHRDSLASDRDSRHSLGARARLPLPAAHALSLGLDLEQRQRRELRRLFEGGIERLDGTLGSAFDAGIGRAVFFVQDDWDWRERSSLQLGLRAEHLQTDTAGPGVQASQRSTTWSPVLLLRHALDTQGKRLLRASLARSVRVPEPGLLMPRYSLNGSYDRDRPNTPVAADSAGNPQLRSERSIGFDLALEQHLGGGGVLSVGVFHRRIDNLIRRRIALEAVPEASVPRWVSRPANFGRARSSGLELELKGRAGELLPRWFDARSALSLRAALSLYRSAVEQIDDPDGRLDGQAPWGATLGFDHKLHEGAVSFGASLVLAPAFATRQTDRQRVWRGSAQRLDAFVAWRIDKQWQLRLAGVNLLARDTLARNEVDDLDGSAARSATRRSGVRQVTANVQYRF